MPYRFVDTPTKLEELCAELSGQPWIAVDCEFMRERTYYPRLCLLQVATTSGAACVDTLALTGLECLAEVIFQPTVTKVFHAAQQDLEALLQTFGSVPAPVFDTQIGATLLGFGDQVGYAALVKSMLGVELDKAHTRTDWSRRPLDTAQLNYAAEDVLYLCDLYARQVAQLEALGRLRWLDADFAALTAPDRYRVEPTEAWRRVKGANGLRRDQLPVLQQLAAWRESRAISSDLPRRWVLSDNALLVMARRPPRNLDDIGRVRELKEGWIRKHGAAILAAVSEGERLPEEQWPRRTEVRAPRPHEEALLDSAMALLRLCALEHSVAPESLGSRRDLQRVLAGDSETPLLSGWRGQLAGARIVDFFDGKLRLGVLDRELKIV